MNYFFSSECGFITEVYLWLKFYQCPFTVVNEHSTLGLYEADVAGESFLIELDGKVVSLFDNSHFIRHFDLQLANIVSSVPNPRLQGHLMTELQTLEQYLDFCYGEKPGVGLFNNQNSNKLVSLKIAQRFGLAIPRTIITTKKNILSAFIERNGRVITKAIQDNLGIADDETQYLTFTEEIGQEHLTNMPFTFFPSLFQQLLEKQFEVRAFYFDGQWFSMAIFSQNDKQTSIDYRKYNEDVPNRNIPIKLPFEIEEKLTRVMKALNYTTGSVDLVCTKDDTFVFLEINPVGQFGMTSMPCNYYLEKIIAEKICGYENIC